MQKQLVWNKEDKVKEAYTNQSKIGWYNLFMGVAATKWAEIQQNILNL
jgi:hypothetical protein